MLKVNNLELKCRFYQGKLIRYPSGKTWYYMDQIMGIVDGKAKWVHQSKITGYLKLTYNITLQQYYNLVIYGDINETARCNTPYCRNKPDFINLVKGYKVTCCSEDCLTYLHAQQGYTAFTKFWNESTPEEIEERLSKMPGYADPSIANLANYNKGLSDVDPLHQIVDFYIMKYPEYPDLLKFGVSYNVPRRYRYASDWRVLFRGKRSDVLKIEYELKEIFKGEWLGSINDLFTFCKELKPKMDSIKLLPFVFRSKSQ